MRSGFERVTYQKNQIGQVICQFRFPEILTINTTPPAEFQECIRAEFPGYSARKELPMPQMIRGANQAPQELQNGGMNYQFVSADNRWRVNLTSKFISFSCSRYTTWEEFAGMMDKPLVSFISVYKPAYFERVGLRYINTISRTALGIEDLPFRDLIQEKYLGVLADEDVDESGALRSNVDAEFVLRGGCRVKLHAGPGRLKLGNKPDAEIRFIFDQDLYLPGKIPMNLITGVLQTLHHQAYDIFRDAICPALHRAMEPEEI